MSSFPDTFVQVAQWGTFTLVDASLKATAVFLMALLAAHMCRGASAAVRHRIWSLGLGGALLMPILSLTVPQFQLPLLPPQSPTARSSAPTAALPAARLPGIQPIDRSAKTEFATITNPIDPFDPALQPVNKTSATIQGASGDSSTVAAAPSLSVTPTADISGASANLRVYLFGVWLAGQLLVLLPLLAGFGMNWLLLRKSQRLEQGLCLQCISDLSAQIGLTRAIAAGAAPLGSTQFARLPAAFHPSGGGTLLSHRVFGPRQRSRKNL
jgi:hypothetical protein